MPVPETLVHISWLGWAAVYALLGGLVGILLG
jgi:hypothetical protein